MNFFSHIDGGSSIFGKAKRIKRVLNILNLNKEQAIYVGDQTTDGEAAHKAGIDFAAVGWGYTSAEKIKNYSAQSRAQRLSNHERIFLNI